MNPTEVQADYGEKTGSIKSLAWLNYFIADVQTGMGPYLSFFLLGEAGWNYAQVGAVVGLGYLVSALVQIPIGAAIDLSRRKRELIIAGCLAVASASLLLVFFTSRPIVSFSQSLVGVAGAIFPPCLAALTLGLVGRDRMDVETGKMQSVNALGNLSVAIAAGVVGYGIAFRYLFLVLVGLCILATACVWRIKERDIDHALARGADHLSEDEAVVDDAKEPSVAKAIWKDVRGIGSALRDKRLLLFLVGVLLFNFAAAGINPLFAGLLTTARGGGELPTDPELKRQALRVASLYTASAQILLQGVFALVAVRAGILAASWGRKPLMLIGFGAIAGRALLYTFDAVTNSPYVLVASGAINGIVSGISAVVVTLITADLTRGTGRFNAAQGAIAVAVGLAASFSTILTGNIAKSAGRDTAFWVLAGVALVGLFYFRFAMPETREQPEVQATS